MSKTVDSKITLERKLERQCVELARKYAKQNNYESARDWYDSAAHHPISSLAARRNGRMYLDTMRHWKKLAMRCLYCVKLPSERRRNRRLSACLTTTLKTTR